MSETRILWEGNDDDDVLHGYAGTFDPYLFLITTRRLGGDEYSLMTELPWLGKKRFYSRDVGDLKAEAERWLSEFVVSLGATFPSEPAKVRGCEVDWIERDTYDAETERQCGRAGALDVKGTWMCEDHAGERGYGPKQEEYGFDPADEPAKEAGQ